MRGTWKELKQRCDGGEEEPILGSRTTARTSTFKQDRASSSSSTSAPEEADILDTGFTLRELGPQAIRWWLLFQIVGLVFQLQLWREVSWHLAEFEDVISNECAPHKLQHGICTGPLWNVSAFEDVVLTGTGWSSRPSKSAQEIAEWDKRSKMHSFQFTTASSPPTFVVIVDPVSSTRAKGAEEPEAAPQDFGEQQDDMMEAHWTLEVERLTPPQLGPPLRRLHSGLEAVTFEDLSDEARRALAATGRVEWRATLTSRSMTTRRTRFLLYAEDARATPPSMGGQCSFGRTWKAFTEQRQGHSHSALSWCNSLMGIFVLVGATAASLVYMELKDRRIHTNSRRFHLVVAAKFVLQDIPQQICIVLYLLGWYEASGLRCQLCLFHSHCETCRCPGQPGAEQAFHFVNLVAVVCTLLSSVCNQLLVRPINKRTYTEDDICLQYTIRIGGLCISLLPFTTGICWASRSILPMPIFFHVLAALPCVLGWIGVASLICVPTMMCCDEELDF